MRILYVTTIGSTMGFFQSLIRELLNEGHQVDIAANLDPRDVPSCYYEWGCKVHSISASRSPFSTGNVKAVGQIESLVKAGCYDIVHCHTPIAAACARLACRKLRKKGLKVIYTAHGFHFFTGAPLQNWLIFYTVEKLCARWTDVLITINKEDYARAQKKMSAGKVLYVPGVGIDVERFAAVKVDVSAKRKELGVPEAVFLLFSVGELNGNKNHEVIIRAMAQMERTDIHYMIAGQGDSRERLLALAAELGLSDRVHLLGFRRDVAELYKIADLFVFPSFREGLPVSVMEAMAAGLPVVCSRIRGNVDLICGESVDLCHPGDVNAFAQGISAYAEDPHIRKQAGLRNTETAKQFDYSVINSQMRQIYGCVEKSK